MDEDEQKRSDWRFTKRRKNISKQLSLSTTLYTSESAESKIHNILGLQNEVSQAVRRRNSSGWILLDGNCTKGGLDTT
jgi:hypothetical protein